MRRKVTKAAALLSAVLMASSSVPYGVLIPYNVLAEEVSADAGAAVQEETAKEAGTTAYSLNAADLDASAFGGLDTKITEDTAVGTDDYFTLTGQGGKILISQKGEVTYGSNTFNQCICLSGALKDSGQAGIKITIPEGKTAKVTVYAAAKSEGASDMCYYNSSKELTTVDALAFGEVNKYTINDLASGSYWLGGSNGAYVYYAEVKYIEKYEVSMLNSDMEVGKISADTKVGTADFLTIIGKDAKNEIKDRSDANITYNNEIYTKALRLGGALSTSNGKSGLKITTTGTTTVKFLAAAKGDSASTLEYAPVGGAAVEVEDGALVKDQIQEYTITNLPAGEYYIGGTAGADIYALSVEYVTTYELDPDDTATFDAVFDGTKGEITKDTAVGTDDYFTLISKGAKIKNPEKNIEYNGTTFKTALRLDGAAASTGQACFKIHVTEGARVTILAAGKNDKGSQLEYVKSGDSNFTTFTDGLVKDSVSEYVLDDLLPGDYYIGSTQGADIYNVLVEYDAQSQKAADWSTVATPVINSVTTDEAGDFVVDFTAVVDKVKGAENVKVTMLQSGYEVSTVNVTAQKSQVTFSPYRSGTYTFVVVAQRTGEADKASEVYTYKDYVLAVKKPVITWAQNKGNGDVYLDWINIEDADSYSVAYKESGSTADYTVVESALSAETGNYTLTGLTAGKSYDIQIKALRKSDGFESVYTEKDFEVTTAEEQPWYTAIVGSAQAGDVTFTTADGQTDNVKLSVSDNSATKSNNQESPAIAGTAGTLEVKGQASGKISDDEDGFTYYYTKIDPNKENFKLSATFEITDTSLTPDNQTGFGIVAADALGLNVWGNADYVHKYFNYVSSMMFSSKQSNPFMRTVTGYTSADTSSNDGVERTVTNSKFTDQTAKFEVGNKYTFTLEKTDEGYTAACNGSEQKLSDNSFTSVQEDGTVVVGIAVSRKVSVKVSDVEFSKSESKGITSNDNGDTKITPDGRVYSTGTCGASEYEYIYVPNCDGTLTVTGEQGDVVVDKAVSANEVVRVNVPLNNGKNTIKSTLKPTASENLTSTAAVIKETAVDHQSYGQEGQTIIVSADAKEDGKGTEESPMSLSNALKYAQPGQTIFLKNGTYSGAKVERSVSGTADKNINLVAESLSTDGTDGVVFTGEVRITGSYWHVYGLYVKDSAGVGIQICGNYNTIEMCTVNHAANSGIQISRDGGADNDAGRKGKLWPTGNLIKNCESFDNCDAGRNDADGFAAKLTCGEDNKFYGCISHNNIDDGWDLYAKSVSGEIGAVTIENCVAYNNGWLTTDDVTAKDYEYGEGNGFKLGGGQMKGAHVLKNSISFDNHAKGITSNSCPDCKIINCISYNNSLDNSAYNVGLNTKDSNIKAWEVTGLISLNNSRNTKLEDLIPFALHSENNYIYDGSASYNNKGEQATEDWFESVDTSVKPTRNEDGTINMHNLLLLKDTSKNTGAVLDVTSDAAKSVKPAKTEVIDGTTTPDTPDTPETPETKKDGAVVDENGDIHYYVDGKEVTDYTGLAVNAETGKKYWFDNGVAARSKEAYDSEADAWYWFDADGTMAIDKDVNIPDGTENGKWVRYDENGKMKKGEDYRYGGWYHFDETTGAMTKGFTNIADGTEEGKWVYYDEITGQMHHGDSVINGNSYHFDDITGKMVHGAYTAEDGTPCYYDEITGIGLDCQWQLDGDEAFWYEGGKRQGLEGRGKEIYDPATDAWYWLDSVDGGKRAMSKDVYQESDGGKWVRYDEEGHMVKGWNELNGAKYYFDPITGAMRKGTLQIDGVQYTFDETTGILIQ